MALLDLKTDLSKFKRDSFTSDIENKSKGIASGLNLDFGSFQPIEDKFKEGVPQPNLDFGGSLDKPTPTVPTSIPGTPDKLTQPPRSFDATLDKPVPTVLTTMEGTIVKSIPIIDSNWTVFQTEALLIDTSEPSVDWEMFVPVFVLFPIVLHKSIY